LNIDTSKNQLDLHKSESIYKIKTCLLKKEKEQQKAVLPSAKTFQKMIKKQLYVNTQYMNIDIMGLDSPSIDQSPMVKNTLGFNIKNIKPRNSKWQTLSSNSKQARSSFE